MSDVQNPLLGTNMVRNHHLTGLILRNNTWHTSEHSLGRASKKQQSPLTLQSNPWGRSHFPLVKIYWDYHTKRWAPTPFHQCFPCNSIWPKFIRKQSWSCYYGQAAPSCGTSESRSVTSARASFPSWQTITISTQYQKYKFFNTHQDTTTHNHKGWT